MQTRENSEYEALKIIVGMFNAAPGVEVQGEIRGLFSNGNDASETIRNLTQSEAFLSLYPVHLTAAQFAARFIDTLLGESVAFPQQSEATQEALAMLKAGMSRSDLIQYVLVAIQSISLTDNLWRDARLTYENKNIVAEYYSIERARPTTTLEELQAVLEGVTSDPASVLRAFRRIDGISDEETVVESPEAVEPPQNLSFLQVTAGNFRSLGVVDMGEGEDTVEVLDTPGAVIDSSVLEIHNAEIFSLLSSTGFFQGLFTLNSTAWQTLTSVTVELQNPGEAQTLLLPDALDLATVTSHADVPLAIEGGSGVLEVRNGNAPITVGVTGGSGFHSVNVTGGSTVSVIDQRFVNGAPVINTTLTQVNLGGNSAAASLTGDGITSLTLSSDSAGAVVNNTTPDHTLTVNIGGQISSAVVSDSLATQVRVEHSQEAPAEITLVTELMQHLQVASTVPAGPQNTLTLNATGADYAQLQQVDVATFGTFSADFSAAPSLMLVDASAGTTSNSVTLGSSSPEYIGGDGIDRVTVTTTPLRLLDGGAGTEDVLIQAGDAQFTGNLQGFEEARLSAAVAGTQILPGVERVILQALASDIVLSDLAANPLLTFTTNAGHNTLLAPTNDTAADALTLALTGDLSLNAGRVSLPSFESLAIQSRTTAGGTPAPTGHTVEIAGDVNDVSISGDTRLVLRSFATDVTAYDARAMTAGGIDFTSTGYANDVRLDGSAFADRVNFNSSDKAATVYGGAGNDSLATSEGDDVIYGGEGNDTISAGNGTNYIDAGPGTDSIQLGGRSNIVHTGLGGDSVTSRNGSHQLYLEDGNDKINFLPLVALDDRDTLHEVHSGQKFAFLSNAVFNDTMSLTRVTLVGPNDTAQDYLNEIHQNTGNPGWRWFQAEGNTHLYFDMDDQSGFHATYDAGIIFTGLLNLAALLTGSAAGANTFEFRVNDF